MNTEHRGHENWEHIFENPIFSLITGPLLASPNIEDLMHPRLLDSDERPMTSTSRRPRRALPQERPQMNAHMNHLVGPPIGGHEFSLPFFEGVNPNRMLNSFFLTFMEQIEASMQDEVKEGLPKEMIDKIKRMKMGKSGQDCSVCSEGFRKGEKIRKLPCKHIFHDKCILPWLDMNSTCPNCRFNLMEFFTENPDGDY